MRATFKLADSVWIQRQITNKSWGRWVRLRLRLCFSQTVNRTYPSLQTTDCNRSAGRRWTAWPCIFWWAEKSLTFYLALWIKVEAEYPKDAMKVLKIVLPFPISYDPPCLNGFPLNIYFIKPTMLQINCCDWLDTGKHRWKFVSVKGEPGKFWRKRNTNLMRV